MGPVDALAALLAFAVPAAAVLRDLAPPRPPRPPRPARPAPAREPVREPVRERAAVPVVERAPYASDHSMLSGLTTTEDDERSAVRRMGAFALLVTLTLLTAAGVYTAIYRTVSGLG